MEFKMIELLNSESIFDLDIFSSSASDLYSSSKGFNKTYIIGDDFRTFILEDSMMLNRSLTIKSGTPLSVEVYVRKP